MSIADSSASALDQVRQLAVALSNDTEFLGTIASLGSTGQASFEGVWGSSSALLAAALSAHAPRDLVVICPSVELLDSTCDDIELFTGVEPLQFPAWETERGERIVHDEIYGQRLRTLKLLQTHERGRLVVTSIESLLQPVPDPQLLSDSSRLLRVGDRIDEDQLARWLLAQHFHNTSAVELPGEFSRRGGILDIFAPDWEQPVRVELFGDEIASIRRFEVTSQRSLATLEEVEVMFARFHQLVTEDVVAGEGSFKDEEFDKLMVLAGVREFPMRVKCATLAWHTMNAAVKGSGEEVTTE